MLKSRFSGIFIVLSELVAIIEFIIESFSISPVSDGFFIDYALGETFRCPAYIGLMAVQNAAVPETLRRIITVISIVPFWVLPFVGAVIVFISGINLIRGSSKFSAVAAVFMGLGVLFTIAIAGVNLFMKARMLPGESLAQIYPNGEIEKFILSLACEAIVFILLISACRQEGTGNDATV